MFCRAQGSREGQLKRFGIYDRFGDEFFFATLGSAVDAYEAMHDAN